MENYNETYSCRNHKYTINLPNEHFRILKAKAQEAGILRVSIYLREIIKREVNQGNSLTMEEIVFARSESNRIASAEHRREKFNNMPKGIFNKSVKKFLDIFSDKQYTFLK